MQALTNIANVASRGPGYFYALHAAAKGANLVSQVMSRTLFTAGNYAIAGKDWVASKIWEKNTESQASQESGIISRISDKVLLYTPDSVTSTVSGVVNALTIRDSRDLKEIAKEFVITLGFAVICLEGASYLFGASKFDVNSVLKYVSPVRLSNESVLANAWTGIGQAYTWGAETYASFRG